MNRRTIAKSLIVREPSARLTTGLMLAFVLLLPFKPLFNAPLLVLAILGATRLASRPRLVGSIENRFLGVAFLCLWLPMLTSLPDAVNPATSIRKTATVCLYYLAGIYVIGSFARFREIDRIMVGVAGICAFWSIDAMWQFMTGSNWFGFPYDGGRLAGVFYPDLRIGFILASFSPLVFEVLRRTKTHWRWSAFLLLPFAMTIFLSGGRTSWFSLAVAVVGYLFFLFRWTNRMSLNPRQLIVVTLLVLTVGFALFSWSGVTPRISNAVLPRLEPLSGLLTGDKEQINTALTGRLSAWETAVDMWSAHWLNGVGARGFRYVYQEHASEDDYYIHREMEHPKHAHLLLLDIAADTGTLGVVGYMVLAVSFFTRLRRLKQDELKSTYPYALMLIVMMYPVNANLGLYSNTYAGLIWWMLMIIASAFSVVERNRS